MKNKKPNIVFYCSWGGFGHIARAFSIISQLPPEGKYTVATPEKWPFEDPNKNFNYIKLPEPDSRIRFKEEDIIVQDYKEGAQDIKGYKEHLHSYIEVLKKEDPDLVVVDNPAEVSLFTKILGYKTVVIYESLDTNDLRWRLSWKNMDKVLAPYPKIFLKEADFPYLKNTYCAGGFTRFEKKEIKEITKEKARKKVNLNPKEKYILLTVGKGNKAKKNIRKIVQNLNKIDYTLLLLYAEPDKEIKNIAKEYENLKVISGVYENIYLYLISVDIIITGAGYNSLMEACYFRKPTIAVPISRIYGEQMFKAEILSKIGALEFIDPENINSISQKIEKLTKKEEVKKMIKKQKKVVDGKGSKRAADKLIQIIKS